jgi:hypothetical protein
MLADLLGGEREAIEWATRTRGEAAGALPEHLSSDSRSLVLEELEQAGAVNGGELEPHTRSRRLPRSSQGRRGSAEHVVSVGATKRSRLFRVNDRRREASDLANRGRTFRSRW